jgi:hypothetical protein
MRLGVHRSPTWNIVEQNEMSKENRKRGKETKLIRNDALADAVSLSFYDDDLPLFHHAAITVFPQ